MNKPEWLDELMGKVFVESVMTLTFSPKEIAKVLNKSVKYTDLDQGVNLLPAIGTDRIEPLSEDRSSYLPSCCGQ
jgi:hypothetical protein